MKSKLLWLGILAMLFALGPGAQADVYLTTPPDSTRYDSVPEASLGITLDFAADADTIIWLGFVGHSGTVVRMTGDIIVNPIEVYGRTITDDTFNAGNRIYPNPRAGDPLFAWSADTLTTTLPAVDYCCGGLLGYQITAMGTAGYCKIYAEVGR